MADASNPLEDESAPGAERPALALITDALGERVAPPAFFGIPFFGDYLRYALYFAFFFPLIYMEDAARAKDWVKAAMIGVAWAVAFPPAAIWFHRRGLWHIGVSIVFWLVGVVGIPLLVLIFP